MLLHVGFQFKQNYIPRKVSLKTSGQKLHTEKTVLTQCRCNTDLLPVTSCHVNIKKISLQVCDYLELIFFSVTLHKCSCAQGVVSKLKFITFRELCHRWHILQS